MGNWVFEKSNHMGSKIPINLKFYAIPLFDPIPNTPIHENPEGLHHIISKGITPLPHHMGDPERGVNPHRKEFLEDTGEKHSIAVIEQLIGSGEAAFPMEAFNTKRRTPEAPVSTSDRSLTRRIPPPGYLT
jgi:hypothetical protein